MKAMRWSFGNKLAILASLPVLTLVISGCSSTKSTKAAKSKEPVAHQRGWIGGEYKSVSSFPPDLKKHQNSAILITRLETNAPAALAGLNEGDLILELNHQRTGPLKTFRRAIDRTEPRMSLGVKFWHDGQVYERDVRVGKETFTYNGMFAVALPGFFHDVRLWPTAGFSLCVVGYTPEPATDRKELTSAEVRYFKNCDSNYQVTDDGWKAWAGIMQASAHKTIRSQEVVPAQTSLLQGH